MEKKLEVKNLVISFRTQGGKVQAVRDVSFDLYKGETLAIVGESGSGKSVTSRAIMGILANNSIVEGGKIIYDGQDLLRISEDDFHKIRGDKIAMIFQDPLSSLNPIMRVGKQLTEAMILKGKTGQRNARRNFNTLLAYLNKNMNETSGLNNKEAAAENARKCKTFDNFCIAGIRLEDKYNHCVRHAYSLIEETENVLFLKEKNQKTDVKKQIGHILDEIKECIHPAVLPDDIAARIVNPLKEEKKKASDQISEQAESALRTLIEELKIGVGVEVKPNYFTMGYYIMKNPDAQLQDMPHKELNKMTRQYLDENFMLDFIDCGAKAVLHSHNKSVEKKKEVVELAKSTLEYFENGELDKKISKQKIKELSALVGKSIDRLAVVKNSVDYTFATSAMTAVEKYFDALVKNPKAQAKYDKQVAKRNKLIAKGKTPDWKVVPPMLVDIDLARNTICGVISGLIDSCEKEIENADNFDEKQKMVDMVDYFKEQASAVVYKVTRKLAKAKALKLMEEVGIPNPAVRYNQYPFEFSGGMRQRIVIAIALAANPDILICDEPTTALDVTIQAQILELINKLKEERHLSVIFITHDLGVVANMADRIAVMYAGKIVEYGTSEDVFYDPRHPYTWALLSSMPDLDTKEKLEAIPGTPPNMIFPPKGDAFAARNKYAMKIDFEKEPPMFKINDTHYAATWLLHPDAPKVDPPKLVTDRINRMKREVENNG